MSQTTICVQLDEVVVEIMCSMKRLEQLREKYATAVGEVRCLPVSVYITIGLWLNFL